MAVTEEAVAVAFVIRPSMTAETRQAWRLSSDLLQQRLQQLRLLLRPPRSAVSNASIAETCSMTSAGSMGHKQGALPLGE
jgi:hypothetical protein